MKILVLSVAASSGGALTILNNFYKEFSLDLTNEYYFAISTPSLEEKKNIRILKFQWVKISWFHRIYFDLIVAPKIIKKNNIDVIFSLQNTIVPFCKKQQELYLHLSIPFSSIKFSIFSDFKMWIYQNIISIIIYSSIKKSQKVIVQTQWMKKAVIQKIRVDESKIVVKPPIVHIDTTIAKQKRELGLFFFPASAFKYKNHKVIFDAAEILLDDGLDQFSIAFTLEEESGHFNKLSNYKKISKHIVYLGTISHTNVCQYYSKSVLLFPSYVETFGLPLLEARTMGSPVIASNCEFSHEILDDYNEANFFDYYDAKKLAFYMKQYCTITV